MKHTIYIVDDNAYVREAIVMLIEDEADLEVCGTSRTAAEALVHVPTADPDLILVDLALPGMNGIELIERLLDLNPVLWCAVVSGHVEPEYATQALKAGARGYIRKGDPLDMLKGIRHVLTGEMYVSPTTLTHPAPRDAARQKKESSAQQKPAVLRRVANGTGEADADKRA